MDHSCMVSAAEAFADLRQGDIQKFTAQVHGYLSGECDILRLFAALDIFHADAVMLCYYLLDQVGCQRCGCVFTEDIFQAVFRQRNGNILICQCCEGNDTS